MVMGAEPPVWVDAPTLVDEKRQRLPMADVLFLDEPATDEAARAKARKPTPRCC